MSWNLFKDLIHLGCGEGPHGLRSNVSECAHARGEGHDSIIVRCLCGKDRVKSAHGPVDISYFDPQACRGIDQRFGSIRSLPDMAHALVGEGYESDIRSHITLFCARPTKKPVSPSRTIAA